MGQQGKMREEIASNPKECRSQDRHPETACYQGLGLERQFHISDRSREKPLPSELDWLGGAARPQPVERGKSSSKETAGQDRVAAREFRRFERLLARHPLVCRVPRWKRPVDFVLSLVLLILVSPVWLVAALAVKLTSPGPILFRQERVGLMLRRFPMFKFRTMYQDADQEVHRRLVEAELRKGAVMEKLDPEQDHRVTRVGRYLRLTSLDELPQLLNVLRGEMSLVGPRPCIAYELETYKPWYVYRFECLPGMTGLWQVSGKNRLTADQMARLDIRYARRQTWWGDFRILLRTPRVVWQEMYAAGRRWWQRRSARRGAPLPPTVTPPVAPSCSLSDSA